jgi:hypothetical protein
VRNYLILLVSFLTIYLFSNSLHSQTLIMNEVSNGPSGNQEYVEFVVVDTSVSYNCASTTPPCIDIRGWIFDDNSGYHGTSGIAAGAVRFSFNSLWSCVPLGTIIVIYNNADPNVQMPANDLSLTDGNCVIVVPISNTSLFEQNTTTPGAVACSYPATGWTAGGNWNFTLLANPGDCARIVNLAGCEVFSVCWGSDNLNTLIQVVRVLKMFGISTMVIPRHKRIGVKALQQLEEIKRLVHRTTRQTLPTLLSLITIVPQ